MLRSADGSLRPVQVGALDRWPDGSIRWVLCDFQVDAGPDGELVAAVIVPRPAGGDYDPVLPPWESRISVVATAEGFDVSAGGVVFRIQRGGAFPFAGVKRDGADGLEASAAFSIARDQLDVEYVTTEAFVHLDGPLRAEIEVRSRPRGPAASPLDVSARLEFFAGSAVVRAALTIHNPQRAQHSGGQWPLGDPGSILIEGAELSLARSVDTDGVLAAIEHGRALEPFALPFELHQESSGGERWNGRAHCNRDGVVPLRFCGYRLRAAGVERRGARATPIVIAGAGETAVAIAVPQFWQNFPQAVLVDSRGIRIQFLPRDAGDRHEIQGGERKTWRAVMAFGPDAVSDPPLAWCHEPLPLFASADWYCGTQAVPALTPAATDPEQEYQQLTETALDPERGFLAKREQFDEYGWRHFGDVPADHESAFQPADRPFVSHYNNQYDAVAGFAAHFLRTGDPRWHALMDDLARHVRDVDIYRTVEDKAAYNGGLFWHTYHYADAGTSTHRTYPRGLDAGGGPSAEHNYPAGMMLHYFLTGERASRDAAVGLADWVLAMDDGRLTPFRWLASGPTGHASATGSPDYHGPGRGAANSIVACRAAYRLTGDLRFADKADELIRRCVHPRDDLDALNLLDTERRWYYTVFLQALGSYLQEKLEREQQDEMFAYARASLLHYATWMAGHERPYLDRPEVLEFPTETWAAQDLRKADVFWWAAQHATAAERDRFLERARFFFDYAVRTLAAMPTRHFTRPVVLLLTNGLRVGQRPVESADASPPVVPSEFPKNRPFRPQRAVAMARAKWLVLAAAATAAAAVWVAWIR